MNPTTQLVTSIFGTGINIYFNNKIVHFAQNSSARTQERKWNVTAGVINVLCSTVLNAAPLILSIETDKDSGMTPESTPLIMSGLFLGASSFLLYRSCQQFRQEADPSRTTTLKVVMTAKLSLFSSICSLIVLSDHLRESQEI